MKNKQYYSAGTGTNSPKIILHCRNRYKMKNKQYYTARTGTKPKTNNTKLPEQVQHPKKKKNNTAGTGTTSKRNNTTLPEQVQHPKQTILHCRNRYNIQIKQYYTAEQVKHPK
jgi:hypothetical protein